MRFCGFAFGENAAIFSFRQGGEDRPFLRNYDLGRVFYEVFALR